MIQLKSTFIMSVLMMSIFMVNAFADVSSVVLFCPSPSQIIINDSGTAQSVDGKWTGTSAIPLKDKDNWQKQIRYTTYFEPNDGSGSCHYFIGGTYEIDLTDNSFPTNYKLYDINSGYAPESYCFDQNPSQAPLQDPTDAHPCYFYKNSVM